MSDEVQIPVEKGVWYKNVSLWTNAITVGCLVAAQFFGIVIDPKIQAGIIAIINIVLQAPKMATTTASANEHNKSVRARIMR